MINNIIKTYPTAVQQFKLLFKNNSFPLTYVSKVPTEMIKQTLSSKPDQSALIAV